MRAGALGLLLLAVCGSGASADEREVAGKPSWKLYLDLDRDGSLADEDPLVPTEGGLPEACARTFLATPAGLTTLLRWPLRGAASLHS